MAGSAHPPRAAILKKQPREFIELFTQTDAGPRVSFASNWALPADCDVQSLGISKVPHSVFKLIDEFIQAPDVYINPQIPLIQQISIWLQIELKELDEVLVRYVSPIYNEPVFKQRTIQRTCIVKIEKNTQHPPHDK